MINRTHYYIAMLMHTSILSYYFLYGTLSLCTYKYELAICSMFKNEAPYLKEWIEFHKLVGVQHFYLYNNFSTDNYMSVLKPYVASGQVEVIDWFFDNTKISAQFKAFNNALKKTKSVVKWLAFIDLDEYLFPVKENSLLSFLKNYEEFGAVTANWVMYGTSDIEKIPANELLIKQLTHCDPRGNQHIKSIIRPEYVYKMSPHFGFFKKGYFQVNSDKFKFTGPYCPYIQLDKIRINHYWTRDLYWLYNIKIPRIKSVKAKDMVDETGTWYLKGSEIKEMGALEWCLKINQYINKEEDCAIYKYVPLLEQALRTENL